MDSALDSSAAGRNELWNAIEIQLLKFEEAWRLEPAPDISRFCQLQEDENQLAGSSLQFSTGQQARLLAELVQIDLEYRWKNELPKFTEDYFLEFPVLADGTHFREIAKAELDARHIAGKPATVAEIQSRFPGECENLIQHQEQLTAVSKSTGSQLGSVRASSETVIGALDSSTAGSTLGEAASLVPGQRLNNYVLREQLGQGAFSTVWKATDTRLKRDVAIKVLRPERIEFDDSILFRLMREARAAAAIDHPGVVRIHEVATSPECTFIVEQFINGPTLKTRIESGRPSIRESVAIIRDVSRAVHEAHQCGVVHRDIKPANILLDGGTRPLLVDFGLAYLEQFTDATLTRQGELLGTPAYMSPQQAQGQHQLVDARADVYSLGAVLYHLLAGEIPFRGTILKLLDDVVHKAPNRSRLAQQTGDRDLDTIVLKCLEKDPADRYQSAAELADDLQRQLDGEPIVARPVGLVETTWKWSKRRPRLAGVMIGMFLLTAFLLGTLIQLRSVSSQRARAEAAEQRSQQLLRDSAKAAGRLAIQRGKMRSAVAYLEQAIELEPGSDPAVELDLIECLIAIRQTDQAGSALAKVNFDKLPAELQGQALMLKGLLELESGELETAQQLFERAIEANLSAGRSQFVQAMLAERTYDCIELLRRSLEFEPHSHNPRRLLVTMLMSLADFDEARREIQVAQQLFPEDVDFQLLESIAVTIEGNTNAADQKIDLINLPDPEKQDWKILCREIHQIRETYTHRQDEFGFNEASLSRIAKTYNDVVAPCLLARGFVFPPKIAFRFQKLFDRLDLFVAGNGTESSTWPELTEVVAIHPEGSLIVLELGTLLSQDKISEAYKYCKKLKGASGYIRDSNETLLQIQFTLALVNFSRGFADTDKQEVLEYGSNAIKEFEKFPQLLSKFGDRADYCRFV